MPWPATVGLSQLCVGVIGNLSVNGAAAYPLSVIQPQGTVSVSAAVGQTVLAAIAVPGATSGVAVSPYVVNVNCQSVILTAGTLSVIATPADDRGRSLIVFLTPATP